ncbi:MAG TPA: DUF1579 domain-containing protein [Planctomycetota bacterium]|nr:DUF1579 domain-containing protein [Planctomycetota bacterium]
MKTIALVTLLAAAAPLAACASERTVAAESSTQHATQPAMPAAAPAATTTSASVTITAPTPAPPTEQHAWLHQLVGEWTFSCSAPAQDGSQPWTMEGTESIRSLGGQWIVAEGRATVDGQPMQTMMSLGYDPEKQAFIGTWIDTIQPLIWSLRGTLDAGKTTLTLEAEGPSFDDPAKTSLYRDALELKDKDHKSVTSSVQGADGTWTTFMRAEYVRVK